MLEREVARFFFRPHAPDVFTLISSHLPYISFLAEAVFSRQMMMSHLLMPLLMISSEGNLWSIFNLSR